MFESNQAKIISIKYSLLKIITLEKYKNLSSISHNTQKLKIENQQKIVEIVITFVNVSAFHVVDLLLFFPRLSVNNWVSHWDSIQCGVINLKIHSSRWTVVLSSLLAQFNSVFCQIHKCHSTTVVAASYEFNRFRTMTDWWAMSLVPSWATLQWKNRKKNNYICVENSRWSNKQIFLINMQSPNQILFVVIASTLLFNSQFFCIFFFFAFMFVVLASIFHSSHRSWDNNKLTNEFNILGAHLPFRAHVNIYWFDMTLFCNNYLERNIWHGQWHAPHITHTVCV